VLAAVSGLYLRRMGDSNSRGVAPNPLSKRAP
jgi:drug/metabolite transporter, DME family